VFNYTFSDAFNYLQSLGFLTASPSFKPKDRVGSQHPVAGTRVPRGTLVTLYR
jgi:beta-lactam-binding protein with PASTA domain